MKQWKIGWYLLIAFFILAGTLLIETNYFDEFQDPNQRLIVVIVFLAFFYLLGEQRYEPLIEKYEPLIKKQKKKKPILILELIDISIIGFSLGITLLMGGALIGFTFGFGSLITFLLIVPGLGLTIFNMICLGAFIFYYSILKLIKSD